jgi:hypothetical protein
MMKKDDLKRAVAKAAVIVACALLPAISYASQDTDAMKTKAPAASSASMAGGSIYVVSGTVFVAQGKNPAHRVTDHEAIVSNTLVNTGENSSALLKFEDGQVVTMQSNSTFRVREYRYDAKKIENSNIVFSMLKGGMRFVTGLIGKARRQAFRLATPNATIGIRGTDFMVTMAGKSMYGQVLTGKIAMTNAAGVKVVGAGQSAFVASPTALAAIVSAAPVPPGTFKELQSIPVDPSAIPAPVPAPVAVPVPVPVPTPSVPTGAAAATGIAGGAIAASPAPEEEIIPEPVKAPEEEKMAAEESSGVALTGKIGTLGLGAELNLAFSDSIGARLGYNQINYNYNTNLSDVNYDAKLKLRTISLLADWYPFQGSFRASGGVVYNDNQATLIGIPSGGGFTVNGNLDTSISSLQAKMSFNNIAPYVGIGWGNPVQNGKGWGMTSDVGVLFQGSPKTTLVPTCIGGCTSGTLSAVDAENAQLQSDLSNFKWWPVISIGISYQW